MVPGNWPQINWILTLHREQRGLWVESDLKCKPVTLVGVVHTPRNAIQPRKGELLTHATTWMGLENIVVNELSQPWKDT